MTDETHQRRPSGQRLDKELLLKVLSEASIRQRRKDHLLPTEESEANALPGGTPGEECPPQQEK